jgi:hypothetical protein
MVTNNEQFINKCYGGLPIYYDKKKAPKFKLVEDELWKTDMMGFDSKIGYITNCSTTYYSMLPLYDKNSPEYEEIFKRLKICRKKQGQEIDSAKNMEREPFPQHWVRGSKENSELDNKLVIRKRPYFMRYLYQDYNAKYRKFKNNFNQYCIGNLGIEIDDLLQKDTNTLSEKELKILDYYNYLNPFLETSCVMNEICRHMEKEIKELKIKKTNIIFDSTKILQDKSIPVDKEKLKQLYSIFKRYKSEKRYFAKLRDENGEERYKTIEQYNKFIREECYKVSSNLAELTNLAVDICYIIHPSDNKSFVWNIFGDGIIDNVMTNKQENLFIPMQDNSGNIEFLGKKYSRKEFILENYEDIDAYNF